MIQRKRESRELIDVCRRFGARPRFPVYMGEDFMNTPIEELELSVRSFNCLRRAGMATVGDIVGSIDGRADLLTIRNLGMRSADEIMNAVMEYQYSVLSEEGKKRYLNRIEELNREGDHSPLG